jgi:signal transduction histidine kinase
VNQTHEPGSELLLRTRWYIRLRWYLLSLITLPTFASLYIGSEQASQRARGLVIVTLALGTNLAFHVLDRVRGSAIYRRALAVAILASDVLLISLFIFLKGGIESRSLLLYALPILTSALFFGRAGVYITAVGSALSYDVVILANYFGLLHSPEQLTHLGTDGPYLLTTIIFFNSVLLLLGVLTDFLTRLLIQKEQEALAAVVALRRAQSLAKMGSWEWDVKNDTITWSDELYKIFGVPQGAKLDYAMYLEHIHPNDRKMVADAVDRSLKTRRPFSFYHRVVGANKSVQLIHGEGTVLTDKHGKVVQLFGTSQDITAERALEAAKGDFVALASHQLRTPASGVRMLLAMLRDGYADPLTPGQLHMVEEAYSANERMLRIADDLLNVAKLESGRLKLNKQQLELQLWLKNLVEPHKLLARERRQRLRLDVPKGVWFLHADPARLAMVLDNLLSNARKYTPPRGLIRIALVPGARAYKFVVSDTGSGMSHTEIANLFGKFTRLDNPASRNTEGTGLGLYLAKSIVDLHRGTIRVKSRPGNGSTFTVTLPRQ